MTPEQRKAYARALGRQEPATWTNIPPAMTGRQVEGASMLPLGRYEMPDGSSQVSFGLPQGALDAYRSMRYGLGYEQDPNAPPGYVSEDAISQGALGFAGSIGAGSSLGAGHAAKMKFASQAAPVYRLGRNRGDMFSTAQRRAIKKNGTPIGSIDYILRGKGGRKMHIDQISLNPDSDLSWLSRNHLSRAANAIGARGIRSIYDELKSRHPRVETITGNRVSGARKQSGKSSRVKLRVK